MQKAFGRGCYLSVDFSKFSLGSCCGFLIDVELKFSEGCCLVKFSSLFLLKREEEGVFWMVMDGLTH